MSANNRKGPIIDPGLCRCCGSLKKCRIINVEYEWQGQKEIYSDMFVDCFGLLLSHLEGASMERLICATCVSRLREACAFRQQVLRCEELLLTAKIHLDNDGETKEGLKLDVKKEKLDEDEILDNGHNSEEINSDYDPEVIPRITRSSVKKHKMLKRKRKIKVDETSLLLKRMQKITTKMKKLENADIPEQKGNSKTKNINNNETMAHHNAISIVENSYVCPFDTSFSDYYCIYCRKQFTDPNKLREHTMTHDPQKYKEITHKKTLQIDIQKIDCRLCTQSIDNIDELKRHITTIHQIVLYPVDNEFLRFRLTNGRLICTECDNSFTFFHALKKHMAVHFGTCICDICGAHYFQERMLILHQKTHKTINENHPCKECGKMFKSKRNRYLHIAKTHTKEPVYPCNRCDEVLFSYTLRYRHMIDVHGDERCYQCEECDRSYDSRKSLREHNRRFHLKIYKHQCDLCDRRFYLPSRLREHMSTHSGERNFRCEYCGKSYPRLRGLKVHMQSHNTEKKYKCTLCSASFTQNVNLKNHIKRQHQNGEEFHE